MSGDRRVIQCNYTEGTNIASVGARAYVVLPNRGNGNDRIMIRVRSRGGRWVEKWEDIRRLDQFRVKTLPPEHPQYSVQLWDFEPEEYAAEFAAARVRWSS